MPDFLLADIEKAIRKQKAILAVNKEEAEVLKLKDEQANKELGKLRILFINEKGYWRHERWMYTDFYTLTLVYEDGQHIPAVMEYTDGVYEVEKGVSLAIYNKGRLVNLIFETETVMVEFVKKREMTVDYRAVEESYREARRNYQAAAAVVKKLGVDVNKA